MKKYLKTLLSFFILFLSIQNSEIYAFSLNEEFVLSPRHAPHLVAEADSKIFQQIIDNFSKEYQARAHFTGIPLTVQCPILYKGHPETFTTGHLSANGPHLSEHTLFQIGSNSKSFVSVVLLKLEEEGLLGPKGLNSTVGDFFPEYFKWKDITISQLLHMTSGIRDYLNDDIEIATQYFANPYRYITTEEILNSEKDNDLMFMPGTGMHYSNTNYVLAGKIAEKVTSISLAEQIQKRIFKPLQLNHSYYVVYLPKIIVPASRWNFLMSGYYYQNGDVPNPPYFNPGQDIRDYAMSWANAAGSIISDSQDLNTYARALFQPKEEGGKLLTRHQIEKQLLDIVSSETGQPIPYVDEAHPHGYGLGIAATYDAETREIVYGHGGGTLGFLSEWLYNRTHQISLVNVVNSTQRLDGDTSYISADLTRPVLEKLLDDCHR
jgi:D-alanyl-D-alanine carboxypeptidase